MATEPSGTKTALLGPTPTGTAYGQVPWAVFVLTALCYAENMKTAAKLYLSSLRVPDSEALLSLFKKDTKRTVAIITTAWNVAPPEKSKPFITATTAQFKQLDFIYEYIDLTQYANKKEELRAKLSAFSAIWVCGGNTFYLNYWMHKSGFDHIITDLLANGIVYGGESAGAVVAGKTLHGIELLDDPNEAQEVIWEGLGLVDFSILPHWQREKYSDRLEQSHEEMQQFSIVKTLRDDQFYTAQ